MISINSDLSVITNIPKMTLDKLCDKAALLIADNTLESFLNKEDKASLDIGIGYLYIKIEDDAIKYKFIPSKSLDNLLKDSIKSKQSPIITSVDKALRDKIQATYKELL